MYLHCYEHEWRYKKQALRIKSQSVIGIFSSTQNAESAM